jgi:hypothetical protein
MDGYNGSLCEPIPITSMDPSAGYPTWGQPGMKYYDQTPGTGGYYEPHYDPYYKPPVD